MPANDGGKGAIEDLYRAPVTVWVEDSATRELLSTFWDRRIAIFVGRGKAAVEHLVKAVPKRLEGIVFGVVDRDFDEAGDEDWSLAQTRVFRWPVHEVENLLFDFELLSAESSGIPAADIEAQAKEYAARLVWWMTCNSWLRRVDRSVHVDFPHSPNRPGGPNSVEDLSSAKRFMRQSPYWGKLVGAAERWRDERILEGELQLAAARFEADLRTDDWKRTFSGKEILRHLRATVPGLSSATPRGQASTQAERDLDLTKRIARSLRRRKQVPSAIDRLHDTLKARAGLP